MVQGLALFYGEYSYLQQNKKDVLSVKSNSGMGAGSSEKLHLNQAKELGNARKTLWSRKSVVQERIEWYRTVQCSAVQYSSIVEYGKVESRIV